MYDIEYKDRLSCNLDVDVGFLECVCGVDEFKYLLRSPGIDDNSFLSDDLFINLHNHTKYSEGLMTAEDLLESAVQQAERVGRRVYFSCTDLNKFEGNIDILNAIARDPLKYDHIGFVPGCVFRVQDDIAGTSYKIIVYGIDPFTSLNRALNFVSANNNIKLEDLKRYLSMYQPNATVCLAHPKRIELVHGDLSSLIMRLKSEINLRALEVYYPYDKGPRGLPGSVYITDSRAAMNEISSLADLHSLLKTGGPDCHGVSFTKRFSHEKDL